MKYNVRKLSRANIEVIEGYIYYELKSPGLGERFLLDIETQLNYISKNPFLFQKSYKHFYRLPLKTFPFIVIYMVKDNEVIIYSVFNTHQNPVKKP